MRSTFGHTAEKTFKKLIFVIVVQPWLHKHHNFQYEKSNFHNFKIPWRAMQKCDMFLRPHYLVLQSEWQYGFANLSWIL